MPEFTFLWLVTVPLTTNIIIMPLWHRNSSRITGPLSYVTVEFPHKGLVDVAVVSLNKLLNKHSSRVWFETSLCSSDVPEMCSIPSHTWNCTVLSSLMAKYEILKIHIITANLLDYSLCIRVFSSPFFKVHTKFQSKIEFGKKFLLVETVATWLVICFGWKPLLLIPSHLTSGLLALRW